MKRLLRTLAVLAALGGGVFELAEHTQNRPDAVGSGTTTVQWSVSTKGVDLALAATGLWAVCRNTISGLGDRPPIATDLVEGRFSVDVTPRLGGHARRRLEGCLEDATIDRISGSDVAFTDHSTGTVQGVSPLHSDAKGR